MNVFRVTQTNYLVATHRLNMFRKGLCDDTTAQTQRQLPSEHGLFLGLRTASRKMCYISEVFVLCTLKIEPLYSHSKLVLKFLEMHPFHKYILIICWTLFFAVDPCSNPAITSYSSVCFNKKRNSIT